MSKEAMKLALEALSPWAGEDANHTEQYAAYHAIREALADEALDKKAENARELGLDYEPAQQERQRWAVFCQGCRKEWSVSYPHPGKSICSDCDDKLAEQPAIKQDLTPEPAQQGWKLVPREATSEMLKAMDECSKEGYDERLYAGHAASVYMAAVDAAPEQPQQEPVAVDKSGSPCPEFWDWLPKAYNFDGLGSFTKYNMEVAFLAGMQTTSSPTQPQQEPVSGCVCRWNSEGDRTVTCERHQGWLDVVVEWAERAREAEKKLKAQPEQESVKVGRITDNIQGMVLRQEVMLYTDDYLPIGTALYTSPPLQRTWVGLTDEELLDIADMAYANDLELLHNLQAKLKELNT